MKPLIVLGMHRSGTSMIAEILHDSGIFMGKNLNSHFESIEHLKLNQFLLKKAHAEWDNPIIFECLLNQNKKKVKIIELINKKVKGINFRINFFGIKNIIKKELSFVWGWKEPRTMITLPIWHEIYPDAKFLIIYRNGIDVANSLSYREKKRENRIDKDYHSIRCIDLNEAFKLWEEYHYFLYKYLNKIKRDNIYELKYESFLENPKQDIENILHKFLKTETYVISNKIDKINKANAFKFLNNEMLKSFYKKVKDNEMMKKIGYEKLV